MAIDIIIAFFLLIFFLTGYKKGFFLQIIQIAILLTDYFVASIFTPVVAPLFTKLGEMPQILQKYIVFIIIFLITHIILRLTLGSIMKSFHKEASALSRIDQLLGGFLGSVKIGIIIYFLICFYLIFAPVISQKSKKGITKNSYAMRIVEKNNLLSGNNSLIFENLLSLIDISKDPEKRNALKIYPGFKTFLMRNPNFSEILASNDGYELLRNPTTLKLLKSEQLRKLLDNFEADYQKKLGSNKKSLVK